MNYHKKKWKKLEHEVMSMKSSDHPFFSIGKNSNKTNPFMNFIFNQNRAAVKMANIDAVFGRMFTDPKSPNNQVIPFFFSLFILIYSIPSSDHLFIQTNRFILLIFVLVPVVLVNIFYGRNIGVQKVH
jgi:hypothetical protein